MANEQILKDPNYINANPATQQAIRDKYGIVAEAPKDQSSAAKAIFGAGNVNTAKNLVKGGAALADTAIEGISGVSGSVLFPVVRPFTTPERAAQISAPVQSPIGRAFGIQNDPAYTGEASRRAVQAVGEAVEPAITKAAELTGAPKEDVANIVGNLSLGAGPAVSRVLRTPVSKAANVVGSVDDAVTARVNALRGIEPEAPRVASAANAAAAAPGSPAALATNPAANPAVNPRAQILRNIADEDTMVGVGAGTPGEAAIRLQRAGGLREPVPLTKGQAGRDTGTLQFEHDIARQQSTNLGAPLINRRNVQNERLLQNFDRIVDEDYKPQFADPFSSSKLGGEIKSTLKENFNTDKKKVQELYNQAKAENANTRVDITDLNKWIDENYATLGDQQVPTLGAVKRHIEKLKEQHKTTDSDFAFNDLQEVYKTINQAMRTEGADLNFGNQLKTKINELGDAAGNNTFRDAQAARRELGNKYQNVAAVDRILANKRGRFTGDAQIAVEDIVDRVVRRGSLEDIKNVDKALGTTARGNQAKKEIRAQAIIDIKNSITKNIAENERGQRVISAKQMDTLVREMDADGKLDYLFGKKGAQEIRDLRDVILDVTYTPQGVNTSGTTSALVRVVQGLGRSQGIGDPFGVTKTLAAMFDERRIAKGVEESLVFTPEQLTKQLKAQRKRDLKHGE